MITHATYRTSDGEVLAVHDHDPSVPNGMPDGLASIACPAVAVAGWLVRQGLAASATYWANQPILAQIAALEAKADTPRARREALLGDTSYLQSIEAQIEALRAELQ